MSFGTRTEKISGLFVHARKISPILCLPETEEDMAGWDRNASRDLDVLKRIMALLFALANLADLAAGASFLRRRRMLDIVSYGEAEARAFVIGMASGSPISTDELESTGDAAHLAIRLRALALMLCLMLLQATRAACSGATRPQADGEKPAGWVSLHAASPVPDTS